jgi:hypothetical protein
MPGISSASNESLRRMIVVVPERLLLAILRVTDDQAEQERLAREWNRTLPEMKAAGERIREQVRNSRCRCELEPEFVTEDDRCGRCFGRRGAT